MFLKNLFKMRKNFSNSFRKLSFNIKNNLEICLLKNQKKIISSKKQINNLIKNQKFKIQKRFNNSKINQYKSLNSNNNLIKKTQKAFTTNKPLKKNLKKINKKTYKNFQKTFLKNNLKKINKKTFKNFQKTLKTLLKTTPPKTLINVGFNEKIISVWLFLTASIVLFMICLGGYTRLSKSGLSMTKWKPVNTKYPNSEKAWKNEFNCYKETPEYKIGNPDISLEEFKRIFFVEYFHRSVGRVIGLVYGLPLIYFSYKGYFTKVMKKRLFFFLCLGGLQGVIGWWMVKSGFKEKPSYQSRPRVSTYRLLTHNTLAITLYTSLLYNSLILFTPLKYKTNSLTLQNIKKIKKFSILLISLIALNLISGVTVAGIDAGKVFNTFPLMNGAIIPQHYWKPQKGLSNLFENCATVQFNHRFFAYLTYFVTMAYFFKIRKIKLPGYFGVVNKGLVFFVNFQVFNGVVMLLHMVPVEFGVLHQGNGVFVMTLAVFLMALCSPRMVLVV